MLYSLCNYSQYVYAAGLLFAFLATFLGTKYGKKFLPLDQGKALAVDSMKSAGKPEGAGIIFVCAFILCSFVFNMVTLENSIYMILVGICMLTGYLDDASKIPWHEYLKGALDLLIAALVAVSYIYFNGPYISLFLIGINNIYINPVLMGICIVILVWWSINVTNCTDGVDGLSATLTICTLSAFYMLKDFGLTVDGFDFEILLFITCLIAYLWFNANPSILLMGDAGSRPMGIFIAITALKAGDPLLYLLFAFVLMADGGIGLIKVALKRFLKISILVNTRTPLHDHCKNVWGRDKLVWIVFRFVIIQASINLIVLQLIRV